MKKITLILNAFLFLILIVAVFFRIHSGLGLFSVLTVIFDDLIFIFLINLFIASIFRAYLFISRIFSK
jgi:hypothetical protein